MAGRIPTWSLPALGLGVGFGTAVVGWLTGSGLCLLLGADAGWRGFDLGRWLIAGLVSGGVTGAARAVDRWTSIT